MPRTAEVDGVDMRVGAVAQPVGTATTAPRHRRIRLPGAWLVVVYAFLLLCIPSRLIVSQIGAPGTPANLFAIGMLLWWLAATLAGQNPVRGLTPLRLTFGILTVTVLLGYVNGSLAGWYAPAGIHQSTDDVFSLVATGQAELRDKMLSAGDRGLLSYAGWAGVLLVTAEGLRSWSDLDLVVSWVVRFGAAVAAIGIVEYFTSYNFAAHIRLPGLAFSSDFGAVSTRSALNRVSSTSVHPIEFGVVMAVLLVLALSRSMFSGKRTTWISTALIGLAMPMSVSRSAILAVAVALLVVFLGWPGRWRVLGLLALPVVVVGLRMVAPGLVGTIRSLFSNISSDPSITGRTADYGPVLAVFLQHPWLGRGLFTFVPRYYRILDNQILMVAIELGVFGLAALLVLLTHAYLMARNARRRATAAAHRNLALTLSGAIAGIALSYLTFDAWGFPMVAGVTFLLLGLSGAAARLSRPDRAFLASGRMVAA